MGLDNIPRIYPCKKAGTAVFDENGAVICEATQKSGGCVYQQQKASHPVVSEIGGTYGMFGTDCWYRGKYGNTLIDSIANEYKPPLDFYGKGQDGEEKGLSVQDCKDLSSWMKDHTEPYAFAMKAYVQDVQKDTEGFDTDLYNRIIEDWIYASWWLEFVADFADGSEVWY